MPLPFGLKLKRTRRYTVSSKSCLVTRIQLLNSEFVEFTLSVESTGQECLEAVAQRLELREITYFSLWYFNKQNQQRWIDLEKPLKKQLDKYGLVPTVYFGVVFYVPTVGQLQQEITRYQYYLQLKKDVLEGRIPCSIEQAIRLAGLAVQADFGDFNRYDSQEFLQKFVLFPIGWIQDERVLEEATQKVALLYQNYRGLPAPEAEVLYMQEVEKMEGYGQESTPAKDSQGTDILLGACLDGIFVKHKNGRPPLVFKWNEINNMTHNKSFFALELANKEESMQFQTEDMETSKYVCRMCLARHKFYKINKSSLQTQPTAVKPVQRRSSTRMSLPKTPAYMMPPPQMPYNGHFTEPYTSSQDNLYMNSQHGYYYHSQTSLDRLPLEYGNSGGGNGQLRNGSVYSAHSTSSLTNPQHYMQPSPMSSNPSITGSDITRPDYVPSHRHSALIPPSYRATPDYNTVMRQKNQGGGMVHAHEHRQSHSMRNLNIGNSYAYSRPDPLVYSQPEIRGEHGGGGAHHHYPFHLNSSFHSPSPYPYPTERRPVVGAVSVPELTNVQLQQAQEYPAANIMRTQVYRPPPPYSYGAHTRPANSTPDLSHHLYVSSSNPDLITTRRVHHSVQTFQEDSLPVAHSLQEVSEPLFMSGPPQHHPHQQNAHKRNSIEIASLAYSLEGMRVKDTPLLAPHGPSSSSQLNIFLERTKSEDGGEGKEHVRYGHKKSLSDATMLVHSSEEEEFEDETGRHTPQSHDALLSGSDPQQLLTNLGQIPLEPPPAYPIVSPLDPVLSGLPAYQMHTLIQEAEPVYLLAHGQPIRMVPSVSDGDISGQNKQKAKKDFIKKRPVSDVPAGKKPIDGLPPAGMKKRAELKKMGPLKVAALNGLTLSRLPLHEGDKDEPETSSNDERCKVLEQRMEQGMVFQEYEQVAKRRPAGDCSIAQLPESGERNRFQDVLPYDDTRVELVPTKENNTGYINASHIRITVGGDEWRYIASQGPLSNTCQDFWQMVWEQGVAIIAMVTAEEESGREKSFRYWPRLGFRHNTVTYGRFKITTRFRTDSGCYATTGLKIKHLLTGQEHTVWHLQYTDWPDHGCPEDFKGFLSYLEEIQSVRRHTNSTSDPKNTNLPVLVHCSAGVGRSGVVILSEVMIACLEHNEMLDIPTVLNMLRQQRMMMVQTISQYSFIYKVLIQFLRNSRLI
ncbi:tyrosine-protein phosphatase non-receptor type 21 isoform X1 [Salmo salar]|uniref:Tyrosine-protein phosphatase non-receptor type n=1 Tax=Salmo salar TaxID=8030 RepID=A0A1S3SQB7_SALSA|nr:tyrosine-protein phosphatase non-receptor type 21-like isoform X1 [Salmo salar]XP_045579515.1 tyrosine-protein phosphatase non-receptor type 21-like isoform X1 [Salmo salar]XP_045579516.1 tyrosine-protein phosphatase non-receptor type 21-like isoform X1 [Salmo salar]XP_045579517.1 tyrosine-protein phosphatase non-receptor type 21-like isoform X1 [Salmo salar]|eukprot:XP_014066537.1 PREDICTED: tyrosine-protein phosphatase non-receptor type 21-like isoform X1 [Salmo salar]